MSLISFICGNADEPQMWYQAQLRRSYQLWHDAHCRAGDPAEVVLDYDTAGKSTDLDILLTLLQLLCEGLDIQPSLAHFQVSSSQLHAQLLHSLLLLLLQLLVAVKSCLMTHFQRLVLVMVQLLELILHTVALSLQLQQQQEKIQTLTFAQGRQTQDLHLHFELDVCDTSQNCKTGSCQAVGCYQSHHKYKLAISCNCIGTNHQTACLSLSQLCYQLPCSYRICRHTGCEVSYLGRLCL